MKRGGNSGEKAKGPENSKDRHFDAVERKPLKRSVERHDNGFSVGGAIDKRSAAGGGERGGDNSLKGVKTLAFKGKKTLDSQLDDGGKRSREAGFGAELTA